MKCKPRKIDLNDLEGYMVDKNLTAINFSQKSRYLHPKIYLYSIKHYKRSAETMKTVHLLIKQDLVVLQAHRRILENCLEKMKLK